MSAKAIPILTKLGNALVAYPETEIQKAREISEEKFIQVKGLADEKKLVDTKRPEPKNRRTKIIVTTLN